MNSELQKSIGRVLQLRSVAEDNDIIARCKLKPEPNEPLQFHYYEYPKEIEDLIGAFSAYVFIDTHYTSQPVAEWITNDAFIVNATMDQLKSIITYIVRSERFSSGSWLQFLKEKRIALVINRLDALVNEV